MTTLTGLVGATAGAGLATGVVLLLASLTGTELHRVLPTRLATRVIARARGPMPAPRIAAAVVMGALVLMLTRWPVAAAGAALLLLCWPALFGGQRIEQTQIAHLEALVGWTESLRDTVSARASLEQAIPATAATAPELIRPALTRLVGLLRARVPLERALLSLSAELNDASADKVIGCLILNTRQRGTGLAAILTALVSSARAELDQRRLISAGRASMRRSVHLVVAITLAFAVFVVIFGHDYVAPYATPAGQVALAVVLALFGTGFAWMRRLAGGSPATPFLQRSDTRVAAADVRVIAHLTGVSTVTASDLAANDAARFGREG